MGILSSALYFHGLALNLDFFTIQDTLPAVFAQNCWQQPWQVQTLYTQWTSIAGPEAGESSKPVAIRQQTLWLYVSHSIWIQEIHFRQKDLLKRIHAVLPDQKIRTIRCQVEQSFFATSGHRQETEITQPPLRPPDVNTPHWKAFDAIADPASREALRRLWLSLYNRA